MDYGGGGGIVAKLYSSVYNNVSRNKMLETLLILLCSI